MPNQRSIRRFITSTEAASMLGVSRTTLANYESADGRTVRIFGGTLHVYRTSPSGQRRFSRREVEELLDRRR